MSKSSGLVLAGKRYWSPPGSAAPAVGLPDVSRWKSDGTFTNHVAWAQLPTGVWYMTFDGVDDYVQSPAAGSQQMNFTSESFTLLAWCYSPGLGAACYIMGQGATDVDGWGLFCFVNTLSLRLNQAAGHTDISAVDAFASGAWQLVGVTRAGNTGQFYINGAPVATVGGGGLVDAVSVAGGNKFLLGIADNELTNAWLGYKTWHRVVNYAMTPDEMARIWIAEHGFFGV